MSTIDRDDEIERADAAAERARSEGNQCIAMGVGVGALGTAAALALGATCPLCFIAAPGLVGVGLYRRLTAKGPAESCNSDTQTCCAEPGDEEKK